MYVRLGFAVAAHAETDVLLVDEILAVGDYAFQQKCLNSMHQRIQNGCTIIFVSHNIETVKKICDTLILLDRGKIKASGDTKVVAEQYMQASVLKK